MGFPSSKFGEKTQNIVFFVEKHHIFAFSSLVFGCYFFQVKWEFSKMGSQTRISCYPGAKWDPILSGMYCTSIVEQVLQLWCEVFDSHLSHTQQ